MQKKEIKNPEIEKGKIQIKPDNVAMLHFFQKGNFSNSSARNTLIFLLQTNLFQSDSLIRKTVTSLVDHSIRSFSNFLNFLILKPPTIFIH